MGIRGKDRLIFCSSGQSPYQTTGVTLDEIRNAVLNLIRIGVNQTPLLFVYLSGHGLMVPGRGVEPHTDVLLCTEFVDSASGGLACLKVDELTTLGGTGRSVAS